LQVLVTDPVMGAVQPRFQVCEDEMDNWQILLGDLRIAPFSDREVFVATLGEAGVAAPVVANLDFSNSISLWRRMKPATAVFSGNKSKFDRVGALWFEVRGLRVRRRAASRNASPGGRAPSLGAAERHLVFARACGSGGVEGPPQIQISHFEFDLVRAA